MKMQKVIAILMILTSSVLAAHILHDMAFPGILCILGLLGLRRKYTWDIKPEKRIISSLLVLLVLAVFALHFRIVCTSASGAFEPTATIAWQTVTRFFLASMILVLFLGSPGLLPASLGLFHLAITICAGQILLLNDLDVLFRTLEILSVVLLAMYAATPGCGDEPVAKARSIHAWVIFGVVLLFASNSGWVIGSMLYRHQGVLNSLGSWLWGEKMLLAQTQYNTNAVGFSSSGILSNLLSMKEDQETGPVLTIVSDQMPGYLRAKAFGIYHHSQWHDLTSREELSPVQDSPFGASFTTRRRTFRLAPAEPSECQIMILQHKGAGLEDTLFMPLGTAYIEAPFGILLRDEYQIAYAPGVRENLGYRVAFTKPSTSYPTDESQRRRMLNLPGYLDPRIRQLSQEIFSGCRTTQDKIQAVVQHFRTHYTYSLQADIPDQGDKLMQFLLRGTTGYCEYFASGAAILLRIADVPTRYVTGFYVTQRDDMTGEWIARNADAHAWVEAWNRESRQWVIVEATVPDNPGADLAGQLPEGLRGRSAGRYAQLAYALYQYGLVGIVMWSLQSYGVSIILPAAIVATLASIWLLWYGRRYLRVHIANASEDPRYLALRRMLGKMDHLARRRGQPRDPHETPYAFSQRLDPTGIGNDLWADIARWYRRYGDVRYGRPTNPDPSRQLNLDLLDLRHARQTDQDWATTQDNTS